MALARKSHAVGNSTRYVIDYSEWLPHGVTITTATVTSPSATLTVDRVTVGASGHVYFYVNGGALGETADLAVHVVDSISETKNDIVTVNVVAP